MKNSKNIRPLNTPKGNFQIESGVTPDHLRSMSLASEFTTHGQYRSIFTRKDTLERISGKGGYVTIAHTDHTIIGYAALDLPNAKDRWADSTKNRFLELAVVEVSRQFRNQGIAKHLLSSMFKNPGLEEKIIYLVSFSWTWDLDFSEHSSLSYRNMLTALYRKFGFTEFPTNDPNICLKPENIFMARVGKNISQKDLNDFKWRRFGIILQD